jgi:glutathione S-transferase
MVHDRRARLFGELAVAQFKLWGNGTSRTLRPIWVAEELSLDDELVRMGPRTGETNTEAYTALNPKQKIPLLTRGGFALSESVAISRYLVRNFDPSKVLHGPATSEEEAKHDEWCFYIYGELDETSLYIMRRHGDLAHIYADAPNAVTASAAYAARHLSAIDGYLADRRYLLGDRFSCPTYC